jgi:heme-degrading monooxygenase HmoA
MFARLQTIHQPAERLDELAELAREQMPGARELEGFRGFYYLIDRAHGKALVLSLWESEADVQRLEAGNAQMREHVNAQARLESPASEIFEVALQAA